MQHACCVFSGKLTICLIWVQASLGRRSLLQVCVTTSSWWQQVVRHARWCDTHLLLLGRKQRGASLGRDPVIIKSSHLL